MPWYEQVYNFVDKVDYGRLVVLCGTLYDTCHLKLSLPNFYSIIKNSKKLRQAYHFCINLYSTCDYCSNYSLSHIILQNCVPFNILANSLQVE